MLERTAKQLYINYILSPLDYGPFFSYYTIQKLKVDTGFNSQREYDFPLNW